MTITEEPLEEPRQVSPLDDMPYKTWYAGVIKRARFNQRRRTKNPEIEHKRDNYLGVEGYVTVADLLEKLEEVAPGVPREEILIHYWQLRWMTDATPEELIEDEERSRRVAEGQAKWKREQWSRLVEEFGPDGPPAV